MTAVIQLVPGDLISPTAGSKLAHLFRSALRTGGIYVSQTVHPLYPRLQLVVWVTDAGDWRHDALHPAQDVGDVPAAEPAERLRRLHAVMLGRTLAPSNLERVR